VQGYNSRMHLIEVRVRIRGIECGRRSSGCCDGNIRWFAAQDSRAQAHQIEGHHEN